MSIDDKSKSDLATLKEKYPISVHGQQCIGPCYYSNTRIIHPLTLDEIEGIDHNFCPVTTFIYTDKRTGKSRFTSIDNCYIPTARETRMDNILRDNVIAPQFLFSSEYFVKMYYKINNLEDLLSWLDQNKTLPYKTKERVFDNSMATYGDQINMVDHRLTYYIDSVMVHFLPNLYRHLKKFFVVENNSVSVVNPDENMFEHKKQDIKLVREYIKKKFLGNDNVGVFLSKCIRYYKEDMTDRHITQKLVKYMIDYIMKRLMLSLNQ